MPGQRIFTLVRYYSSVTLIYSATLLFAIYLYNPALFKRPVLSKPISNLELVNKPSAPMGQQPKKPVIIGKPVRLVIPKINRDIRVMEGHYNPADGSWTLRDGKLETYFAMPSALANDTGGNTIIYGHSNRYVFSPLVNLSPGDIAQVFTENGLIFTYEYKDVRQIDPDDVTDFTLKGRPQLILQTCSGNWYEKRGMYRFILVKTESQNT